MQSLNRYFLSVASHCQTLQEEQGQAPSIAVHACSILQGRLYRRLYLSATLKPITFTTQPLLNNNISYIHTQLCLQYRKSTEPLTVFSFVHFFCWIKKVQSVSFLKSNGGVAGCRSGHCSSKHSLFFHLAHTSFVSNA